MIKDNGSMDMRGIDYVRAKACQCPRCKQPIKYWPGTSIQNHTCGMVWRNVYADDYKKLMGYCPLSATTANA